MATSKVKTSPRLRGLPLLSVGCLIALSATASGQSVGDAAKARVQEMDKRELQLSGLGRTGRNTNDPKRAQALMDQVGEDFQHILILHNEIVRAIAANSTLSHRFVSDATGEIKKRATRLQSTLNLPKPELAEQKQRVSRDLDPIETKEVLIRLCKQIESFVGNPIIKTGVVDAPELAKARSQLESVVELSEAIKKGVDREKKH